MKFHYYKSAKRRAIEGILITTVFVLLVASAAFYLTFIKKQPAFLELLNSFIPWLLGGVISVLYWVNYRLYKSTDYWEIMITDTAVIWKTPKAAPGEINFQIKINEIESVICEESTFTDGSNCYYLCLRNKEEIELNHSLSGLNINKFILALEKSGIKYEHRTP